MIKKEDFTNKWLQSSINETETEVLLDIQNIDNTTSTGPIHRQVTTMCILPELSDKQREILINIYINQMENIPSSHKLLCEQLKGKISHNTIKEFIELLNKNLLINRIYRIVNHEKAHKEHSLADKRYFYFELNQRGIQEQINQNLAIQMKKNLFRQKTL